MQRLLSQHTSLLARPRQDPLQHHHYALLFSLVTRGLIKRHLLLPLLPFIRLWLQYTDTCRLPTPALLLRPP
jgi:hypothetical protein